MLRKRVFGHAVPAIRGVDVESFFQPPQVSDSVFGHVPVASRGADEHPRHPVKVRTKIADRIRYGITVLRIEQASSVVLLKVFFADSIPVRGFGVSQRGSQPEHIINTVFPQIPVSVGHAAVQPWLRSCLFHVSVPSQVVQAFAGLVIAAWQKCGRRQMWKRTSVRMASEKMDRPTRNFKNEISHVSHDTIYRWHRNDAATMPGRQVLAIRRGLRQDGVSTAQRQDSRPATGVAPWSASGIGRPTLLRLVLS